jgi:hypothetical protein
MAVSTTDSAKVMDSSEQGNDDKRRERGARKGSVPRELMYPGLYYFFSQMGQRIPFAAITSLTVFFFDHGYTESQIALVRLCTGLPYVVKVLPALMMDRRRHPWKRSPLQPSGRWRPAVMYSTAWSACMILVFAFLVGVEPDMINTPPSLGLVTGLAFLTIMGVATTDAALDAHACEMVSEYPPDYLQGRGSMKPWGGRVLGMKTLGSLVGFATGILVVTQIGPAWSYTGALAVLAVPMLPTLFMLPWLKDTTGPAPDLPDGAWEEGKFTCTSFLDRVLARGPNAEQFRIFRAACLANFLIYAVAAGWESLALSWSVREWDITSQEEGAARTLSFVCWVVGGLVAAPLCDFCGAARVVTWATTAALVVIPFNWVMLELGSDWTYLIPSNVLCAIAWGCATESNNVLITFNVPAASPAGSYAVASLPANLGYGTSAILLAVAEMVSYRAALAIMIIVGALATILVWISIRGSGSPALKEDSTPPATDPTLEESSDAQPAI